MSAFEFIALAFDIAFKHRVDTVIKHFVYVVDRDCHLLATKLSEAVFDLLDDVYGRDSEQICLLVEDFAAWICVDGNVDRIFLVGDFDLDLASGFLGVINSAAEKIVAAEQLEQRHSADIVVRLELQHSEEVLLQEFQDFTDCGSRFGMDFAQKFYVGQRLERSGELLGIHLFNRFLFVGFLVELCRVDDNR